MKNSFLIYHDYQEVFDELTDEQSGKLIKVMIAYSKTGNCPELDGLLKVVFIPIKQQMDRNKDKYNSIVERNKKNGSKGGRPKKTETHNIPNNPVGILGNPEKPKKADKDKVKDKDNVKDNISSNKKSAYGNEYLNALGIEFEKLKGHRPIETNYRREAWALAQTMRKTLKDLNLSDDIDTYKKLVSKYFEWAYNQDWFEMVQKMRAMREHWYEYKPIFEKLIKKAKESNAQEKHKD